MRLERTRFRAKLTKNEVDSRCTVAQVHSEIFGIGKAIIDHLHNGPFFEKNSTQ